MLELINIITPSQFMILVLVILVIATIIGDSDITPWVAASIVMVAAMDYLGFSPLVQLIVFSASFIFFIFFAKNILYKNQDENLITEDINSMLNRKIIVKKINKNEPSSGSGMSENGKSWNIRSLSGESIFINSEYQCCQIEGLTLIIK